MNEITGFERLLEFPSSSLRSMAESFLHGSLSYGITQGSLASHIGSGASELLPWFRAMLDKGWSTKSFGWHLMALHLAKKREEFVQQDFDLAFSGPPVQGTPVFDTPTMVQSLFGNATCDVLIASYVFRSAASVLKCLVEKHDADSNFRVRFIVDLSHQRKNWGEPLPIVAARFKKEFFADHWPGERYPEIWHDPRVFNESDPTKRGVMHAKVVVIDNTFALVTSANFTEAAHHRNIEAGVLFKSVRQVARVRSYFEGLMSTGQLARL